MGAAAEAIRAQGFRLPDRDWLIWAMQARQSCPASVGYYKEQPWHHRIVTTTQSGYEQSTHRDEIGTVTLEDDEMAARIGHQVRRLAEAGTKTAQDEAWALIVRWRASPDVYSVSRVCRQHGISRQRLYELANVARHWVESQLMY